MGSEVRAGCGCKTVSGHDSGLSTNNNWDHGYRLELIGDLRSWGASAQACTASQAACSTACALDCRLDR